MSKIKEEMVVFLYQQFKELRKSELTMKDFCKLNGIDFVQMNNFKYAWIHSKCKDPQFLKTMEQIVKEAKETRTAIPNLFEKYNTNKSEVSLYKRHMYYRKVIENYEKQNIEVKENPSMNFIKVPEKPIPKLKKELEIIKQEPEPELIEKQNDIELIISNGVRVIIPPNFRAISVIKIIELLKDLK